MLRKISITTLLLGVSYGFFSPSYAEMPGFYAEAQLGYVNTHLHTSNLLHVTTGTTSIALPDLNNTLLAYRLSFGYQFNSYWAIELGYRRFSNADMATVSSAYTAVASTKERAIDFIGKAILPLTSQLSTYGKLGVAYVKPNSETYFIPTAPAYIGTTTHYSNVLEPTFGLGLSYAIKPNVPIDFSWNRIQKLGGNHHAPPSSDFFALGVSYYFG